MKVEIIDWPPTVIVDGKVVYQEEPAEQGTGRAEPAVFAVADEIPDSCSYLTAGKEYPVLRDTGTGFETRSDDHLVLFCLWSDCGHLAGADWKKVVR